jgi:hypothetical protein
MLQTQCAYTRFSSASHLSTLVFANLSVSIPDTQERIARIISLVGRICGSLMQSSGAGKLGSCSRPIFPAD